MNNEENNFQEFNIERDSQNTKRPQALKDEYITAQELYFGRNSQYTEDPRR